MPELLTPGVFIQEVEFGPQPIEGISTSTAGFVGEAERGPTNGPPLLVTSFADFQRRFGGFVVGKFLPLALRGFFENGGKRAYISRVVDADTAAASLVALNAGYEVALLAPQGIAASPFTLRVASVVGAKPGNTLVVFRKSGGLTDTLTINAANAATNTLTVTGTLTEAITPAGHAVRYAVGDGITPRITFAAADPGNFGDRIRVRLTAVYIASAVITGVSSATEFLVNPVSIFSVGETVEFDKADGSDREYVKITNVDPSLNKIAVSPAIAGAFVAASSTIPADFVRSVGWRVDVFFDGNLVETTDQISSDNLSAEGIVEKLKASRWVRVNGTPTLGIAEVDSGDLAPPFALLTNGEPAALAGGADGTAVTAEQIIGDDAPPRSGLKALEAQDGISIIAAPGYTKGLSDSDTILVTGELIAQAERRFDRFAVLDSRDDDEVAGVLQFRNQFNSRFGAMYHPWLQTRDPVTNLVISIPPSGHVTGAYARTDNERGVFKAPANVVVRGITGFSRDIPDGEQDILNPAGVNVLRRFDGLGNVIWGARTISSETLWRYVSVRRLFIFIEQSLVRGTRFAVFEPNDLRLWARLRDGITNFLTTQWRSGALFGAKPEQAFFVKVDETTTTEEDRQLGRVNIIIGIAPVRPAEFIIFQIGQAPQSVIIAEQG